MPRFGGIPVESGSRFGGVPIDESRKSVGDATGLTRAGLQGATFGWADELGAAVSALVTPHVLSAMDLPQPQGDYSQRYSEDLARIQQEQQQYAAENPLKAGAAELAGGLATGIATAGAVPVAEGVSALRTAATLAGTGAAQGAVYGAGSAKEGERLEGAAIGGATGAIAAPLIGAALKGGGKALKFLGARLIDTPKDQVVRVLRTAAENEGLNADDAVRLYQELGPEATLADLGESFRSFARVTANKFGPASTKARQMVNARQVGQQSRLMGAAEQALGATADDFRSTVNTLTAQRSAKAKPLYESALSKDFTPSPALKSRIESSPSLKRAIAQGEQIMKDEGEWTGEMNLVKKLNYAKIALDREIEGLYSSGKGQAARSLVNLKNFMLNEVDAAIPEYKQARDVFAGDSALLNAAKKGSELFKQNVDDVGEYLSTAGESEKEMFRLGALRAIQDKMDTIPQTNDSIKKLLGAPRMQKLLSSVFPDQASRERFINRAAIENEFARTRNVITGNSTTAGQLAAAEGVTDIVSPQMLTSIVRGDTLGAAQSMIGKLMGRKDLSPQMLQEASDILFKSGLSEKQVFDIFNSPAIASQIENRLGGAYGVGVPVAQSVLSQGRQ